MAALGLAGCSSGEDPEADPSTDTSDGTASSTTGPTETSTETSTDASADASPTADVAMADGVELTAQGTDLKFRDSAKVDFQPDRKRSSVLKLTVTGARKGRLSDFKGFILDDNYKKKANYYYVDVTVKNLGKDNVGGAPVPLWGVNGENTLLPAVNFTTSFGPCASTPLPEKFRPGRRLKTCLVYLSPDKGKLESVSFRPNQAFDPIEWTGDVKPKKRDASKKKKKPGKKTDKQN
ncbi:MAG: hypothetical protein H0V42_05725 [Nocardioidaceae bacterium]|nr:hypothetical protein [Nocardioidaceae bacterium]